MTLLKRIVKNKLFFEQRMDNDAMAFVHLNNHITATINGRIALVAWSQGLALVLACSVDRPPITTVTLTVKNDSGSFTKTYAISDIPLGQLAHVKEIEFRFFVAPMCHVADE